MIVENRHLKQLKQKQKIKDVIKNKTVNKFRSDFVTKSLISNYDNKLIRYLYHHIVK